MAILVFHFHFERIGGLGRIGGSEDTFKGDFLVTVSKDLLAFWEFVANLLQSIGLTQLGGILKVIAQLAVYKYSSILELCLGRHRYSNCALRWDLYRRFEAYRERGRLCSHCVWFLARVAEVYDALGLNEPEK